MFIPPDLKVKIDALKQITLDSYRQDGFPEEEIQRLDGMLGDYAILNMALESMLKFADSYNKPRGRH